LAENPQQTVRELQELIVTYVKQETVEPLTDLRNHVGWAIAGAVLLGFGTLFLEIGLLRLIQEETFPHLTGNWSWVPYLIVVVASALAVLIVWSVRSRRKAKQL
jgi:membrane protein implicated in regulation of membrane protease activity